MRILDTLAGRLRPALPAYSHPPVVVCWGSLCFGLTRSLAQSGVGRLSSSVADIYRLCPANEPLTEACLNKLPLEFATPDRHMARFADSTQDCGINATMVTEGGGKGWMIHPFPTSQELGGDCDYVVAPGHHCFYQNKTRDMGVGKAPSRLGDNACAGCGAPGYASDRACPCPNINGVAQECPGYEGIVMVGAGSDPTQTPGIPGVSWQSYALEDGLKVPASIAPGAYILAWRWDCEVHTWTWL